MTTKLSYEYKNEGNEYFKQKEYQKAIQAYSQAIKTDPSVSIYFSNRAMAYKQLKQYDEVLSDTTTSIELDDKNIKAYLLAGQTMAIRARNAQDLQLMQQAIGKLTKAMTLCAGQNKQEFEKQLTLYIYRAKKLQWFMDEVIDRREKRQVLQHLKETLNEDSSISSEEKQQLTIETTMAIGDPSIERSYDIPVFLLDPISHKLVLNPVTTEFGDTYEKEELYIHLGNNNNMDPLSNKQLNRGMIYNNLNLKYSVEDFLKINPWAFEHKEGEKMEDICF